MALACDVRLAKQGAGRIGLPEVNLGVLPGLGGTQRLAKGVGKALAVEMMGKGETFSFDRGKELGIINELFPRLGLREGEAAYAQQFRPARTDARAVECGYRA